MNNYNSTIELRNNIKNDVLRLSNESNLDINTLIDNTIEKYNSQSIIPISDRIKIKNYVINSISKFDILTEILDDDSISEIMINGYKDIFLDCKGKVKKWDKSFESEEQLYNIIQLIVGKINRVVNYKTPIVDARLPDGSRVHIVLPPISLKGPIVTIRKFPERFTIKKLIEIGSINEYTSDFLKKLVESGYNIFICGGTGSGKTTFLNALSEFIPQDERVITIEDSAELNLSNIKNLVTLETRNKNIEGNGEIDMSMLIKASLRMNPDRIIVGEVRGKEALDMLQAMNTGHDGSMSTGHANSSKDMLSRLETMVLMAGDLPLKAIRQQISSSIDIIIHLSKLKNKKRVVDEIIELGELNDDKYTFNKIYNYYEKSENLNFRLRNESKLNRKL